MQNINIYLLCFAFGFIKCAADVQTLSQDDSTSSSSRVQRSTLSLDEYVIQQEKKVQSGPPGNDNVTAEGKFGPKMYKKEGIKKNTVSCLLPNGGFLVPGFAMITLKVHKFGSSDFRPVVGVSTKGEILWSDKDAKRNFQAYAADGNSEFNLILPEGPCQAMKGDYQCLFFGRTTSDQTFRKYVTTGKVDPCKYQEAAENSKPAKVPPETVSPKHQTPISHGIKPSKPTINKHAKTRPRTPTADGPTLSKTSATTVHTTQPPKTDVDKNNGEMVTTNTKGVPPLMNKAFHKSSVEDTTKVTRTILGDRTCIDRVRLEEVKECPGNGAIMAVLGVFIGLLVILVLGITGWNFKLRQQINSKEGPSEPKKDENQNRFDNQEKEGFVQPVQTYMHVRSRPQFYERIPVHVGAYHHEWQERYPPCPVEGGRYPVPATVHGYYTNNNSGPRRPFRVPMHMLVDSSDEEVYNAYGSR